jgi:hypothetical protein
VCVVLKLATWGRCKFNRTYHHKCDETNGLW